MRRSSTALTFFRVVKSNPPSIEDVTSAQALGRVLADPKPEKARLWLGLSVYDTEARARKKAKRVPLLGTYIAKLDVPADGTIRIERTTTSSGHFTLWGAPEDLLRCIVTIVPVHDKEDQNVV